MTQQYNAKRGRDGKTDTKYNDTINIEIDIDILTDETYVHANPRGRQELQRHRHDIVGTTLEGINTSKAWRGNRSIHRTEKRIAHPVDGRQENSCTVVVPYHTSDRSCLDPARIYGGNIDNLASEKDNLDRSV